MISERDRDGLGYALGVKAEDWFVEVFQHAGWTVEPATKQQNIMEHWDYKVSKDHKQLLIDVKAEKRIARSNTSTNNQWVWLELKNNAGYDGWLYNTHADYLAFQRGSVFYLVTPAKLREVVGQKVQMVQVAHPHLAQYKLFQRKDRKDLLTLIKYSDLPTEAIAKWI
jgi:hypothetical protein